MAKNDKHELECGTNEEGVATLDTPVHINVTPIYVDHPEAICRIEARTDADEEYVNSGMITLPARDGPYMLNFYLQDGVAADLAFDEEMPWSCRPRKCPDLTDNNRQRFPSANVSAGGKLLKVRATPSGKNAWHYSLNFNGSVRCDPIIIHD